MLPAPVGGVVARRSAQVGQRVAPGAALMTVVPLDQVWVEANFKEGQLRKMRIGQPVKMNADLYGLGDLPRHDRRPGCRHRQRFALLPAQNATGNWIKVVQRARAHHARSRGPEEAPAARGPVDEVEVDVGKQDGEPLTQAGQGTGLVHPRI